MSSGKTFENREELEAMLQAAVQQVDTIQRQKSITPAHQRCREVAAIIGTFSPQNLKAVVEKKDWFDRLNSIANDCDIVAGGRWLLKFKIRQAVLKRLVKQGRLPEILAVSEPLQEDPYRQVIKEISAGMTMDLKGRTVEQLRQLKQVLIWFGKAAPTPIRIKEVEQTLAARQLVEPFYKLTENFCGRTDELTMLRDFVEVYEASSLYEGISRGIKGAIGVSQRKPQVIWGAGGIGKSALIGRFILEHVEIGSNVAAKIVGPQKIPYAYLDFDRVELDPLRPESLLTEVCLQLLRQYPDEKFEQQAIDWQQTIRRSQRRLARTDPHGPRSQSTESDIKLVEYIKSNLGNWLEYSLYSDSSQVPPLLLVLDTFEEVQLGGEARERQTSLFVEQMQVISPRLRVVICGRAKVRYLSASQHELTGLDSTSANQLLIDKGIKDTKLRNAAISRIGTSPLSLILAAEAVNQLPAEECRKALADIRTRNILFQRIDAAEIQGQLYHRILKHIRDLRVRKLAYPGLILRRITPEIIRDVLAEPCRLNPDDADSLFQAISENVTLVNHNADGSLQHRPDVRRVMIRNMLAGTRFTHTIVEIQHAAVNYYASLKEQTPITRGEQAYHMMMLGKTGDELERIADDADRRSLELAWEDPIPPRARAWLTRYLGFESSDVDWQNADLDDWEQHVFQKASELLAIGEAGKALERLREREDRTPGSLLYILEVKTLERLGRTTQALNLVDEGINSSLSSGSTATALRLSILGARLALERSDIRLFKQYLDRGSELTQPDEDTAAKLELDKLRVDGFRMIEPDNIEEKEEATTRLVRSFMQAPKEVLSQESDLTGDLLIDLGSEHPVMLEHAINVLKPAGTGSLGTDGFINILTKADMNQSFRQRKPALLRELGVNNPNAPWEQVAKQSLDFGTFDKALTAVVRHGALDSTDLKLVADMISPNFSRQNKKL